MGGLISCNKKINEMYFVKLDHRPKEAVCALMVQEQVIIKFKDGSFWTNRPRGIAEWVYCPGSAAWTRPLMTALRALKVINTQDIKEHMELCDARSKKSEREIARSSLKRLAQAHGFEISEEQKKKLRFDEEVA